MPKKLTLSQENIEAIDLALKSKHLYFSMGLKGDLEDFTNAVQSHYGQAWSIKTSLTRCTYEDYVDFIFTPKENIQ